MKIQRWSYGANPAASTRDAIRFLIGDTNSQQPLLDDMEVAYLLAEYGTALDAAIAGCYGIAAQLSRESEEGLGEWRSSKPAEAYLALAKELEARRGRRAVAPYCGGLSIAEKSAQELDLDRVRPAFRRDLHKGSLDPQRQEDRWWP